ncbi:hypothetical protein GCM10008933_15110 [Paenibacillus motobuensis]|uniref:Uncharacterized protein n=1 Tax=Paenibacillus motobuensis TaxID=295324 RepID=A0ABN0Y6Z7_9BACL
MGFNRVERGSVTEEFYEVKSIGPGAIALSLRALRYKTLAENGVKIIIFNN